MDYRYERKFYIVNKPLEAVETIVKMHPYGFSEIFAPRQINNIYLDFHNLQNFYDNVDGLHLRKKHRIRWYGDTFGDVEKPVLEIKLKNGLLGSKLHYKVNPFTLDRRFTRHTLTHVFDGSEAERDGWVRAIAASAESEAHRQLNRDNSLNKKLSVESRARDLLARSSSYASANQSSRSISRFITDALEQDVVAGAGDMETELHEEETEFEPEGQAGSNIYSQFAVRVPRDVDV